MTALAVSNVALWLVVIGLSVALLAVVRQLGVLHERIAPVGALMLAKGLKVGEFAPTIAAQDLEGRTITVGVARADELTRIARELAWSQRTPGDEEVEEFAERGFLVLPGVVPREVVEAAARAMREQDVRKESIFRQSVEAERNKSDLLEKKFAEAVKKAKEAPDPSKPFLRDFDLD